jgi:hypothetical protein
MSNLQALLTVRMPRLMKPMTRIEQGWQDRQSVGVASIQANQQNEANRAANACDGGEVLAGAGSA